MKNRSIFTPLVVGFALISLMILMAKTDVFQPLIQFIHTGEITSLQALWCILATALAFGLTLKLLIMLGEYFLPKAEKRRSAKEKNKTM